MLVLPNTPPAWQTYDPVRACRLCTHGVSGSCSHPALGQRVPFERARQPGGACGPEAIYLEIKQC